MPRSMYREVWLMLGNRFAICNTPHLLQIIKLRIQTALVELMTRQAMMFLPNPADSFLHNKVLAQPH